MELYSGTPFWQLKNGLIASYPALQEDKTCDIAIVGGGITGALVAYYLEQAGQKVIVLDARDIATGSTNASTALLQYEIDTPLVDLIKEVGRADAERSYVLGIEAIQELEQIVQQLGANCGFKRKKSLYLASHRRHVSDLKAEYEARIAAGIQLEFLDKAEVKNRFGIDRPAALLSEIAAQVDPYCLTHALLHAAIGLGTEVYDRTSVTKIYDTAAHVELSTNRETIVKARQVIIAAGYEAQDLLPKPVATLHSTYAFISEPLDVASIPKWGEEQPLLWESDRPYTYMRTTDDQRILVGGADDPYDSKLLRKVKLEDKADKLLKQFNKLFPTVKLEPAYIWTGTFGETEDGLAYIGKTPELPKLYFALGYGGNGITYSVIAAGILRDLVLGKDNPDARIFSFDRHRK